MKQNNQNKSDIAACMKIVKQKFIRYLKPELKIMYTVFYESVMYSVVSYTVRAYLRTNRFTGLV